METACETQGVGYGLLVSKRSVLSRRLVVSMGVGVGAVLDFGGCDGFVIGGVSVSCACVWRVGRCGRVGTS